MLLSSKKITGYLNAYRIRGALLTPLTALLVIGCNATLLEPVESNSATHSAEQRSSTNRQLDERLLVPRVWKLIDVKSAPKRMEYPISELLKKEQAAILQFDDERISVKYEVFCARVIGSYLSSAQGIRIDTRKVGPSQMIGCPSIYTKAIDRFRALFVRGMFWSLNESQPPILTLKAEDGSVFTFSSVILP